MFKLTREWLFEYYGSTNPGQKDSTRDWLLKYGQNVLPGELDEWSNWKHLSEYQVNTNQIVPIALGMVGKEFDSELEVHRIINLLRVPIAHDYERAISFCGMPRNILELGVGGDSAISTSIFLCWCEKHNGSLLSVDRNPLSGTANRYGKYSFWKFVQSDSIEFLNSINSRFDMIFIDTIHSYAHTLMELEIASKMSNYLLMDDATFEGNNFDEIPGGVKRAISEWLDDEKDWHKVEVTTTDAVCLLRKNG